MESKKKQLWTELLEAWNPSTPACLVVLAEEYTARFPDDFFGWLLLADGMIDLSAFEKALVYLSRARRLAKKEELDLLYRRFAKFYREKGQLRREERWYRKALAQTVSQGHLVLLGACLAKQGRYAEARDCHSRAAKFAPETADEAYLNLGLIYRAEGQYVEALRYFEKALVIDPDYDLAEIARADVFSALKLRSGHNTGRARIKP